jgi:hypothetical protein
MYHTVRVLKREWWFQTGQEAKAEKNLVGPSDDNLTLKHISGSFYILLVLLAVCSLSFILEHVHAHWSSFSTASSAAWKQMMVCLDQVFVLSSTEMDSYT